MVTERVFVGLELDAGQTSDGYRINLGDLGASGDFGLQVISAEPVVLYYRASASTDDEGAVDGGGVMCEHEGGIGTVMYWPSILPAAVIWVYAEAPADGDGAEVTATLNVF